MHVKISRGLDVEDLLISHTETLHASDAFELIKNKYNNDDLYFIMGSDNSEKMPTWKNYEYINSKYKFIVLDRNNSTCVSSTKIRNMIRNNVDVEKWLNPEVINYIKENNLYTYTNYAINQANNCLKCKNPMCKKGCPINTNIPDFIEKIKTKKFEEAYNILLSNNILSEICSTICPAEYQCVGNCVRAIKGNPVKINELEKFINNWAKEHNIQYNPKINNSQNIKVAIIGSGPAGIACAVELRKAGANVTIFEKEQKCGGILEYGIPDFRLSKKMVADVINKIKNMGIEIQTGIEFGKDITVKKLKEHQYSNIFLSFGAQKQSNYKLTEKNISGIYNSDDFLKKYNTNKKISNLGTTVVIGGGNVAFDTARAATRMGADKVYVLYRRNKKLMPARELELNEAIQDGVEVMFQTKVISAKGVDNRITEIECICTKIENEKVVDIESSKFKMKANTIVFAIGSKPNYKILEKEGIEVQNGLCKVDENYMTNIDGIYAGGDLVETKSTVARAISTGKKAAYAILNRKESDK